jgi:hypothetical protein
MTHDLGHKQVVEYVYGYAQGVRDALEGSDQ